MIDTPIVAQTPMYKVLQNGASCHGGQLTWSLPTQNEDGSWTPGEWMRVDGTLIICQNALHLTDQPAAWYQPEAQCWRTEYRGDTVGTIDGQWESKLGVREARLLAPVAWEDVAVWTSGQHVLKSGIGRASDSATVEAYGSATVEAYGSATVRAYDSATVEAYDSATVEAYGSATVRAYDSATVEAYGSATVISTPYHSASAEVALSHLAAHVDRRDGKLVLRSAEVVS
jgi:hypothetical protein